MLRGLFRYWYCINTGAGMSSRISFGVSNRVLGARKSFL